MNQKNMINISISMPIEIVDRIDKERGDIARSRFIAKILGKHYGK